MLPIDACSEFICYETSCLAHYSKVHLSNVSSPVGMGFLSGTDLETRNSFLANPPLIHKVGVFVFDNVTLSANQHCFIWSKDQAEIVGSELTQKFVYVTGSYKTMTVGGVQPHCISEPCIPLVSWGPTAYGHFITDYIPRILAVSYYDAELLKKIPLYLPSDLPSYMVDLLKTLCPNSFHEIKRLPPAATYLFSKAYIPTLINVGERYHPCLNSLIDSHLNSNFKSKPVREKIFVSRQHKNFKGLNKRLILNEAEVENVIKKFGYKVVSFEDLNPSEKIQQLRSARCIVGGWGSGLHNSLYSGYGVVVGSIGAGTNSLQSGIGALRSQPTAYIQTSSAKGDQVVDIPLLNKWLEILEQSIGD